MCKSQSSTQSAGEKTKVSHTDQLPDQTHHQRQQEPAFTAGTFQLFSLRIENAGVNNIVIRQETRNPPVMLKHPKHRAKARAVDSCEGACAHGRLSFSAQGEVTVTPYPQNLCTLTAEKNKNKNENKEIVIIIYTDEIVKLINAVGYTSFGVDCILIRFG